MVSAPSRYHRKPRNHTIQSAKTRWTASTILSDQPIRSHAATPLPKGRKMIPTQTPTETSDFSGLVAEW